MACTFSTVCGYIWIVRSFELMLCADSIRCMLIWSSRLCFLLRLEDWSRFALGLACSMRGIFEVESNFGCFLSVVRLTFDRRFTLDPND